MTPRRGCGATSGRYRDGQLPVAGRHPSTSIEGGLAIIGDEDTVASQVLGLVDCGVTDVLCSVFGSREDKERTRKLLASLVSRAA